MRTVYFLGAGASKSIDDSFPLAGELLERILDEWKNSDPDTLVKLRNHLREFHGNLPEALASLGFEGLLAHIEFAIETDLQMGPYTCKELERFRKQLLYCLWVILGESETGVPNSASLEACRVLGPLIWQCEDNSKTTIITTNYDLLIEYAISQKKRINPITEHPIAPVNYCLPIRHSLGLGKSNERLDCHPYLADKKQITCLKLHGSVNWMYCPQCDAVDWTGLRPLGAAEAFAGEWLCCDCPAAYEPLVIPPASSKSTHFLPLKQIWKEAGIRLSQAERIVFAGFSLSEGDVEIQRLLLLAKEGSQSLQQVLLVDLSAETLLEKYKKIYGDIAQLTETRDWKEYVSEHIPIIPYAR